MFSGATSFCRRRYCRDLTGIDVAVIGVPHDTSVTNRPGTRFGPRGIRTASTQLSWSRAWPSPFDPFERLSVVDWGDIWWDVGDPSAAPAVIESQIAQVLASGTRALLLGGDHFISYPSLRAHSKRYGPLGFIHFDAHSDTWDEPGVRIDHGTMFTRALNDGLIDPDRAIQVGLRSTNDDTRSVMVRDAITVHDTPLAETIAAIRDRVGGRPCYLTFDIDCLDPAFAPGTGTPVIGGLTSHQALSILRGLSGLNIIGGDVVEVSPPYDVAEITALAGATIALQMLCLFAGHTDHGPR